MTLDELVARFGHVWHVTFEGGWEGIQRSGLRSASDLLAEVGRGEDAFRLRAEILELQSPNGPVVLRDQVPNRKDPAPYLDGISVDEWWALVNSRSYFFASERDAERLVGSYTARSKVQEVIKFISRPLFEPVAEFIEVTTVNAGVFPRQVGPTRGPATFQSLDDFSGDPTKIKEITITAPVPIPERAVLKVMRVEPDRKPTRIWPPVKTRDE